MCGLAAIFNYKFSGSLVNESELVRISEQMYNRGPDAEGLWISNDKMVGLAHRRLSIIDLTETGAQPMTSLCGRYHLVFNGEIYMFQELRLNLISKGIFFRGSSDTEVLLALYAEHGENICSLLRGMYAFVIWDDLERSIFAARDPLGMKPLYFYDDGNTIRFASQVKALLAGGSIPNEFEPAGVVGYSIWGSVPEPFTLYKNVFSLEAGTWLKINSVGSKTSGVFQSLFDLILDSPAESFEDSDLGKTLRDSVRHHLIADVPVGIFLSAGVDSGSLLALASEFSSDIHTVTLGFHEFRGTSKDETREAELTARKYGAKHQTIWIAKKDFESKIDNYFKSMDQPSIDGLNTYLVAGAAAETGLKVALSGLGGDEFFGGYLSFTQIPKIRSLGKVFGKAPSLSKNLRMLSAPLLRTFTSEKYAGLLEYGSTWFGAYMLRRAIRMPWESQLEGFDLPPDFISDGLEKIRDLFLSDQKLERLGGSFEIVSYLESTQYMRNQLLRDSDWAGMAHSLEIRLPFLDLPLISLLFKKAKAGSHFTKEDILNGVDPSRKAEKGIRNKTGFLIPIDIWTNDLKSVNIKTRGLRKWQNDVYRKFMIKN